MEQERFNDYVTKMDIVLDGVKKDFSNQLQTDDKVKCVEYTISVTPSDIELVKKTEKTTYQDVRIPTQYEEEVKISHITKIRVKE